MTSPGTTLRRVLTATPLLLVGCTSVMGPGVAPQVRTVASVGDRALPIVDGPPGDTVVASAEPPEVKVRSEGRVSGRVVDERGEPVPNASVRLAMGGAERGRAVQTETDGSGAFTLRGLRRGVSYTVVVESEDGDEVRSGRAEVEAPEHDVRIALGTDGATQTAERLGESQGRVGRVSERREAESSEDPPARSAKRRVNSEDLPETDPSAEEGDVPPPDEAPGGEAGPGRGRLKVSPSEWHRPGEAARVPESTTSAEPTQVDKKEKRGTKAPAFVPLPADQVADFPPEPETATLPSPEEAPQPAEDAPRPGFPVAERPALPAVGTAEAASEVSAGLSSVAAEAPTPMPVAENSTKTVASVDGGKPAEATDELMGAGVEAARPAPETAPPAISAEAAVEASSPVPTPETESVVAGAASGADSLLETQEASSAAAREAAPVPVDPPTVANPEDSASAPPASASTAPPPSAEATATEEKLDPLPGVGAAAEAEAVSAAEPVVAAAVESGPAPEVADADSAGARKRTTWGELVAPAAPVAVTAAATTEPRRGFLGRRMRTPAKLGAEPGTGTEFAKAEAQVDSRRNQVVDFTLPDLQGRPVRLRDLDADLILLDFWGTWCGPCVQSVPHLIGLQEKMGARTLRVVGIAYERSGTAAEQAAAVKAAGEKLGITYPLLLGNADSCPLQAALHVGVYPTMVLLDRQGNILWRDQGASVGTLARLDKVIDAQAGAMVARK